MANRKGPEPNKPLLAPLWIVTFGDLISLLVTFFILLYTFSAVDQDKFRRVAGTLTGSLGVMTDPMQKSKRNLLITTVPPTVRTDLRGSDHLPNRKEIEDAVNDKIQDPSVFDQKVDMEGLSDGMRIRLDGDHFFAPGRTTLDPNGREVLLEIARFFEKEPVRLVIESHTDTLTPTVGGGDGAMALTRRTAREMARTIVLEGGWDASRVGACAMGSSASIAENDTATGRRRNRRIEIRVIFDPQGRGRL
ncbi:MAG: OmpA family protein [Planctomycetes bacterium]|nr:OmpA family protein [Planctomycetota bacterium]